MDRSKGRAINAVTIKNRKERQDVAGSTFRPDESTSNGGPTRVPATTTRTGRAISPALPAHARSRACRLGRATSAPDVRGHGSVEPAKLVELRGGTTGDLRRERAPSHPLAGREIGCSDGAAGPEVLLASTSPTVSTIDAPEQTARPLDALRRRRQAPNTPAGFRRRTTWNVRGARRVRRRHSEQHGVA